jgi:heterodisulfide reductase subunit A-like polyferredoxin
MSNYRKLIIPDICATTNGLTLNDLNKNDECASVIVAGGGVMGRSIAANIASRGEKVVLIDESHIVRSSWGDTRK